MARSNHSDEYFELLGWTIFITNVEANWGFKRHHQSVSLSLAY
ncbi:MAG: hypothetical protein R2795_26025 [Saprospiraceae bacterium]